VGLLPFKTGTAWLALRSGCPIVPVGVTGAERVWHWKRGWRPWRRPRVSIVFGEPYRLEHEPGAPLKVELQSAADQMARRIADLLPEGYRGVYARAQGLGTFEKISS